MRIRLVRPFGPLTVEADGATFSTELRAEDADALLCEWRPTEELLSFDGPSAWYTCEPRTNPKIGVQSHPDQRRFLGILRPEQLLHHAHEDPRWRVPHMTHATPDPARYDGPRQRRAASVVSNFGGPIRNRGPDIRLRNAFVTAPGVDLFGRRNKWRHYRAGPLSPPRTPRSWKGEVEGDWPDKLELLARYHAAVCLENTYEPWYLSEKLVDAARSGCVPIYRAHPTVRDGILAGARWVDPADFGLDPAATLEHALALDREEVAEQNHVWLGTEAVRRTSELAVWSTIAAALARQRTEAGFGAR